ncbi:MAG: ABC transporter permease subunit [Lachnospiraceae bacterium]|nr:ABC transporter permease subunit [Lachnospiraceae bacterium]
MSNLYVSPEKEDAIPFSDPLFDVEITAMVRSTDTRSETTDSDVRWQDYNSKRIGVLVGPLMEDAAAEFFPDSEYLYFDSYPDCATALLTGKIDGFLGDEPGMISMHAEQPEIDYIHEPLTENNYAFAFRKDDPESAALCEELDEFLSCAWEDGTMDEIAEIWLGVDEARKVVDMSDLTGENGTIRVATTSTDMPWSYIKDGKNVGYDIDLVVRFCRDRGYGLEIGDMDFAGRIPAVQSGKYDFTTDMNVTPEREEQVLFSDPTSQGGIVLAVRAADLDAPGSEDDAGVPTLADMEHASIAVLSGTTLPEVVERRLPDAEILYYNSTADVVNALKSGKADAVAIDEPVARNMMAEDDSLSMVSEKIDTIDYAFAFGKSETGEALCAEVSAYLRGLKSDRTMAELQTKWFDSADLSVVEMEDYRDLPAVNGTVHLAAFQYPPFVLRSGEALVGYEIELMTMFCCDRGYALEISDMNNDGILPAVQSGKCDIGCCGISVTEERKESILFSEPDYTGGTVLLVMKAAAADSDGGFLSSVADSFQKTFIRESRWQLFLQGIGTTLLITVLSILFGTALGFAVFMLCRNGTPVANRLTRLFVWLVQGMPVVVLLMILYYIIFGGVAISGAAVSVVGFTLVFGAAVYAMLRSGVGAVDRGQMEAAYALGYTNRRAFYRVILPQALPHFMPAYKGEITSLIKATAVVGYVAVQDLTKMGDIVRSRTYEAFFPLIAVAIIYFILAAILTFAVKKIEIRIDPKQRTRKDILKGVNIDD